MNRKLVLIPFLLLFGGCIHIQPKNFFKVYEEPLEMYLDINGEFKRINNLTEFILNKCSIVSDSAEFLLSSVELNYKKSNPVSYNDLNNNHEIIINLIDEIHNLKIERYQFAENCQVLQKYSWRSKYSSLLYSEFSYYDSVLAYQIKSIPLFDLKQQEEELSQYMSIVEIQNRIEDVTAQEKSGNLFNLFSPGKK